MRILNTAATGNFAGLWTGIDAGYFQQQGIDMQIDHIDSTSRAIPALLAHQDDLSTLDGQTVIQADLKGGDIRFVAAVSNRLLFSMMVQPDITTGADLKGRLVGITSPGSSADTAAHQAVQVLGLQPSDVSFIPLQNNPSELAGLEAKQIDAAMFGAPFNTTAREAGFHELVNLATAGPPFISIAIGGSESFISSHPDLMLGFVRGYSQGLKRFKNDQAFAIGVLSRYLDLNDESVLEDSWNQLSVNLPDIPAVDQQGMQNVIDSLADAEPDAAGTTPNQYIDAGLVQTLQEQGFYR